MDPLAARIVRTECKVPDSSATDTALFEEIYQTSFDSVWRHFARMGLGSADTQDLVQEVFLAAYRSFDRYDPSRAGRAWVMGIAVNVGKQHWRKIGRSIQPRLENAPADSRPPNQLEVDDHNFVCSVLAKLSDERREIVELHVLEQHSLPEVATILGLPVNTVYSRFRRARLELKDRINQLENVGVDSDASTKGRILAVVLAGGVASTAGKAAAASTAIGVGLFVKVLPVAVLSIVAAVVIVATTSTPEVAPKPAVSQALNVSQAESKASTADSPQESTSPMKLDAGPQATTQSPSQKTEVATAQSPSQKTEVATAQSPPPPVRRNEKATGERALIMQARSALNQNNGVAALKALTAHKLRYPKGSLKEAAHALRVRALVRAGRQADARIEALSFLEIYPASKHRVLIKKLGRK